VANSGMFKLGARKHGQVNHQKSKAGRQTLAAAACKKIVKRKKA
jgi:hypothetical protein